MADTKREFLRGARNTVPLFLGIAPFAMVVGVAAREAGLDAAQGTFFSLSMIAGTAQLAAVQLYGAGASAAIVLLTAMVVNLRYSMYSLSLHPVLEKRSYIERLLAAFLLSDQSFVVSMTELETNPDNSLVPTFLFGSSLAVYVVWVAGIFLGFVLKAIIPAGLYLDFVIPLAFMFLLVPHLGGKDRQISVLASIVASVVLVPRLPLQSGLLVSILIGIGSGMAAGEFLRRAGSGGERP
ncbi:MAG TPA: AzlC family ABC transporter permease [Synergistales bacterium]|nr:AzlC family ABC transporter permease [Synergistales bacterium]